MYWRYTMSKDIYTHKHHIIPKHMGGTDDPSNIIELTVEEHAEAHKKLYEKYGKKQDKLAWQGLAGIIGKEELVKELCVHRGEEHPYWGKPGPRKDMKNSDAHNKAISEYAKSRIGKKNPFWGKKHTNESNAKRSESLRAYWAKQRELRQ